MTDTTQFLNQSTARAVIEWPHGLEHAPVVYAVGDTFEETRQIEKYLASKLGDRSHAQ